jgi:hypothetical protein
MRVAGSSQVSISSVSCKLWLEFEAFLDVVFSRAWINFALDGVLRGTRVLEFFSCFPTFVLLNEL